MALDDDDPDDREDMERFNQLLDRLNELVRDEHHIIGTRALCIALRHALLLIPDIEDRSRQVAICMNTLEDIPALDPEVFEPERRPGLRRSYRDTREP